MLHSTFTQLLWSETAAGRQQWDLISQNLITGSADEVRSKYISFLKSMLVFHQAVESSVYPVLVQRFPAINTRKKSQALVSDLIRLDVDLNLDQTCSLNIEGKSLAYISGISFAAETSVLGSFELSRNLRSALSSEFPAGFLSIYGSSADIMWKVYLDKLVQYSKELTHPEKEDLIRGAAYAFSVIGVLFGEMIVSPLI